MVSMRWCFWLACGAVTVLSLLPVTHLPPQALDVWDKAQHALGFAVLMVLGLLAYPEQKRILPTHWAPLRWMPLNGMALGLMALGVAIELAQHASGWRYGEVADVVADAVGIALGAALVARVMPWFIRWFIRSLTPWPAQLKRSQRGPADPR
jgi:VanZ family protein